MRVLFLGTGEFGVQAIDALVAAGHELLATVSQPDRPSGRQRVVKPTPVHAHADALRIRHLQVEDVNSELPADLLDAADVGVVVAFGQKLAGPLLARIPRGFVNIHASLLPKYRGAAPYQWAIINGDAVTGVTTFRLDERWDTGPIWGRRRVPIAEGQTADELHDALAIAGGTLIVETLQRMSAGAVPEPQTTEGASRAPKLSRADAIVDWSQPARRIARRINGLWSWPAATCVFVSRGGRRERVQLARATAVEVDQAAAESPHVVGEFLADGTVLSGEGRVRIHEIKPDGGKLMAFDAFRNGRRVAAGDRFLPLDES